MSRGNYCLFDVMVKFVILHALDTFVVSDITLNMS